MANNKAKRILAILLLILMLFFFLLTVYFGLKGNTQIAISLFAFNGFFTIVVYFLMRIQRSISAEDDQASYDDDDDTEEEINMKDNINTSDDE